MKITEICVLPVDRYLFVQVYTDAGIVGLGESGAWGYLEASAQAIESFRRYLIGQDPLRIEHHWQYLYRCSHFRGAAIMGALSAVDIALWDIAGKHFGVPYFKPYAAQKIHIPIATGERLHTIYEFEMLLARNAVQYVRPDVCMAGGISHCKKIAALAEAHHVGVVPHNPLSPVSTAACVQLAACIPNFALQEYPKGENETPKKEIVSGVISVVDGFLTIPAGPGIGVELAEHAVEKYPFRPQPMVTRLHVDGSVVDQ